MKIKWERTFFSVWSRVVLNRSLRSKQIFDTFSSPESVISVEILCRCRMPWVWYHIKNPALNMADCYTCHQWYHRKTYLGKCLMKINRYKYVYMTWRFKRDISLIPPCIHQLFLQTNACSEVTKEHKKKGWNLFVITTLKVITTLILVLLPLFLTLNIFKNFFLCLLLTLNIYWFLVYCFTIFNFTIFASYCSIIDRIGLLSNQWDKCTAEYFQHNSTEFLQTE